MAEYSVQLTINEGIARIHTLVRAFCFLRRDENPTSCQVSRPRGVDGDFPPSARYALIEVFQRRSEGVQIHFLIEGYEVISGKQTDIKVWAHHGPDWPVCQPVWQEIYEYITQHIEATGE